MSRHFKICHFQTGEPIAYEDIPLALRDQLIEDGLLEDANSADQVARLERAERNKKGWQKEQFSLHYTD